MFYTYQNAVIPLAECVHVLEKSHSFDSMCVSNDEKHAIHSIHSLCQQYIKAYDNIGAIMDLCVDITQYPAIIITTSTKQPTLDI